MDALPTLTTQVEAAGEVGPDLAIVAAFAVAAIALGSLTLRRRTPERWRGSAVQ